MCMHLKHDMDMCCECWSPVLLSLTLTWSQNHCFSIAVGMLFVVFTKRGKDANLVTPMCCLLHCFRIFFSATPWIPSFVNTYVKRNIFSLIFCPCVHRVWNTFFCLSCSTLHWIDNCSLRTVPPFSKKFSGYLCKCCNVAVNELKWNY